jgi:transcriptional regulator with XRE-family HTH domain
MAARIKDVARRVGVSSATVSRVLSNKPHVSEEVRRRILAAMEELDYQLSRVARSLRVQHSRIIGLIISDIQNPFSIFSHVLSKMSLMSINMPCFSATPTKTLRKRSCISICADRARGRGHDFAHVRDR